jgi:hypothetical protein
VLWDYVYGGGGGWLWRMDVVLLWAEFLCFFLFGGLRGWDLD